MKVETGPEAIERKRKEVRERKAKRTKQRLLVSGPPGSEEPTGLPT
jgi:hypothetical protein